LLVGHAGGALSLWDLVRTQEVSRFQLPGTPTAIAYGPDGARFAASYTRQDRWCLAFHDAASGTLLRAVDCPEAAFAIAWHPDGRWISVTGGDADEWTRGVRLIPADSGAMILLGRHKIKTATVAFSPDGNYLMSSGWEREMFCWDLQNQQRVFTFANAGYAFDWSLDGLHCATTPKGHGIQFYAFERPSCLELNGNRGERLRPGAFSPDGRYLALADSKNLCVWDLEQRSSPPALLIGLDPPLMPFFSPDSSQLFVIGGLMGETSLKGWELRRSSPPTGPPELIPANPSAPPSLNWAALAGDELLLTSGEGARFLSRTNFALGEGRVVKIPAGSGTVSPDGRWLAVTYSYSPLVTVYRLPDVEEVARLRTGYFVASVWFAPKGDELTVINRGGVEQWDTTTWRLKRRQPGFPVSFSYVLYTPDGTGVWRVTNFRESGLYDRNTLEPVLPLPANVIPLAVSGDGRRFAVSVDDQRVQIWDLPELRSHFRSLGLDW
jgi:WD40 repeat protein